MTDSPSSSGRTGAGKGQGITGPDNDPRQDSGINGPDDRVYSLEELEEVRMKKTTGIAGNIFKAPRPESMILGIISLSFLVGYLTFFDLASFGSNFTLDSIFTRGMVFGIVMIGIPAVLTSSLITPAVRALGGIFYIRRGFLLSFTSILILTVILLLGKLASLFIYIDFFLVLALGYAWILAFHLSLLLALSNRRYSRSLPPALIHPVIGLVFLYLGSDYIVSGYLFDNLRVTTIAIFFIIFFAMTGIWIVVVTMPLRREYKINGLDLARNGFLHFTEGEGRGMAVETFFESFGMAATVSAGVLAVRRKRSRPGGKDKGQGHEFKAVLVVPDIHKGPFGFLAGSNMPAKLYSEIKDLTDHVLVPHGTATHDFNPVSSAETLRLGRAVRKGLVELRRGRFSSSVSRIFRTGGKPGVNISLQYVGDNPVGIFSAAPEPTDDIDPRVGELARRTMRHAGSTGEPFFIDGHNSMQAGKGYVHFNSPQSRSIMDALKKAVVKARDSSTRSGLEIGIAQKRGYNKDRDGLGPMGIQVMVVKGPGGTRTAYILFDGNNLKLGLLDEIRKRIGGIGLVDDVEALTTDNHIVNMTMGGYSPVGERIDQRRLFADIESLVRAAVSDLEPVEVASKRITLDNFRIFGKGNTLRLSTTLNDTMALMGRSFVICYGTATGLAMAALTLIFM